MKEIKQAVDDLGYAFTEFKSESDNRLESLEGNHQVSAEIEQKLSDVTAQLTATTDRLNTLERLSKRPQFSSSSEKSEEKVELGSENMAQKSAFSTYVRRGDERDLQGLECKSLSASSDPDGGYLVPETLGQLIQEKIQDYSVMRRLASVTQISTDSLDLLRDKGGTEIGWAAETGDRAETTTPQLIKKRIPVHEMFAKPRATQKLLDDSRVNIEEWLSQSVARQMAKMENQAFVRGDGNSKPRGFLKHAIDYAGGQDNQLQGFKTGVDGGVNGDIGDLLMDIVAALETPYLAGAKWLMPRSTLALLRKQKTQNGTYLWEPGLNGGHGSQILGHDVVICDDMPALVKDKKSLSLAFGDFKEGYQIVDRSMIRVLRDPYSAKPYVEFYTTSRVGGDVINSKAIKVLNFSA